MPQTLPFHVPGQPLWCSIPSRFTYNPFLSFLGHLLLPSVWLPHVPSLPHFLLALPLAATSFSLSTLFSSEIFWHPCRKPSCPHFLSRYLAIFRRLLTFGPERCLWNHVGITRMPQCVQYIHEPYARILNRLPQHSAQAKLLGNSCQEGCRLQFTAISREQMALIVSWIEKNKRKMLKSM